MNIYTEDITKNKISILCSRDLNEEKTLQKYGLLISNYICSKTDKNSIITIGNLRNGNLIKYLKDNNFRIDIKKQHPKSLIPSNKKLIKESNIVIFLNYNSSKGITTFLNYAKSIENKKYYELRIEDKDI